MSQELISNHVFLIKYTSSTRTSINEKFYSKQYHREVWLIQYEWKAWNRLGWVEREAPALTSIHLGTIYHSDLVPMSHLRVHRIYSIIFLHVLYSTIRFILAVHHSFPTHLIVRERWPHHQRGRWRRIFGISHQRNIKSELIHAEKFLCLCSPVLIKAPKSYALYVGINSQNDPRIAAKTPAG